MTQRSISANQYDLSKALTMAALLKQPKEPLNGNIDDAILSFFAGSAMNDVSHPVHCGAYDVTVRNASTDDFQLPATFEATIVAKGSNCHVLGVRVVQEAMDKVTAHFSGGACHEDALHDSGLSGTVKLVPAA